MGIGCHCSTGFLDDEAEDEDESTAARHQKFTISGVDDGSGNLY